MNDAYGLAIKEDDLPVDGSDMITKRVERVLQESYGMSKLDKRQVLATMLGVVAPLWLRAKSAYGGGRGMFRA